MRTIIDIPNEHAKILNQLSKKKNISRAEMIRQAIANYIANDNDNKGSFKSAFGIWKNQQLDSIKYQQNLRDEWDR